MKSHITLFRSVTKRLARCVTMVNLYIRMKFLSPSHSLLHGCITSWKSKKECRITTCGETCPSFTSLKYSSRKKHPWTWWFLVEIHHSGEICPQWPKFSPIRGQTFPECHQVHGCFFLELCLSEYTMGKSLHRWVSVIRKKSLCLKVLNIKNFN